MAKKAVKKTAAKARDSYTGRGLAIIGPYGNIWGSNLFSSKAEALVHLKEFWRGIGSFNPKQWKVVQASVVVRADRNSVAENLDR